MSRFVAQIFGGFGHICLGVAHITDTEVSVSRLPSTVYIQVIQLCSNSTKKLIQAGSRVACNVVNFVLDLVQGGSGRQYVGLYGVINKTKIPTGLAITIDIYRLPFDHRCRPLRNDRRVSAIRVLTRSEHVEVAEANGLETIGSRKHAGVELVNVFGHRIRRQRIADLVFHLGQIRMVAIGGAGSSVGKAAYFFILGCYQHVQEAVDIGLVGGDGVFNGAWYRAQGGLVENVVRALYGFAAIVQVADVAFDEAEAGPLLFGDQGLDFVQVVLVPGCEIVQADYCLVQFEQGFQQVGAYEAGYAGY